MKARVSKILSLLETPVDALLFANSVDPHLDQSFFYVFDVPSGLFEGSVAVAHAADGRLDVVTSPLETQSALEAVKADPSVTVSTVDRDEADPAIKRALGGASTIGLHFNELTHAWYERLTRLLPDAKLVDVSKAVRKARVTKDAGEVARLRRAAEIGSAVGREIPSLLHPGVTELEVAAEIEYRMGRHGASGRSFGTIVAFGPHGAEPHFQPGGTRLSSGTSIVCDFGAFHQRYASDITRSFRFGTPEEEMRRVHEKVEEAQAAAFRTIRPGVPAREVHLAAAPVIDDSPWKGRLIHGVGHSIGLAVHDGWGYGPKVDDPLEVGMVFTVEPGIYLPGKGGVRIEDDVVVTPTGYELLSTAPRSYLEVPA